MKREIAAITLSALLSGTALAGPVETQLLPPPAQTSSFDDAKLRGVIEDALKERKHQNKNQNAQKAAPAGKPAPPALSPEDWGVYSSAELWLEGIPEPEGVSYDALSRDMMRYPGFRSVDAQQTVLPTAYGWNRGNWKANVGTNVLRPTSTSVIPTDALAVTPVPDGGTGEFQGRIEYDVNAWQFYGGTKRELVANANGTVGVNNNFNGGTFYNLPQNWLGGKVGTGFEVNPVGDAKARVEYRQMFGNTEGFVAVERSTPYHQPAPDVSGVNALKTGINRKF